MYGLKNLITTKKMKKKEYNYTSTNTSKTLRKFTANISFIIKLKWVV